MKLQILFLMLLTIICPALSMESGCSNNNNDNHPITINPFLSTPEELNLNILTFVLSYPGDYHQNIKIVRVVNRYFNQMSRDIALTKECVKRTAAENGTSEIKVAFDTDSADWVNDFLNKKQPITPQMLDTNVDILTYAALKNLKKVARILLKHEVDPSISFDKPLDEVTDEEINAFLLDRAQTCIEKKAQENKTSRERTACEYDAATVMETYLEKTPDLITAQDNVGYYLLTRAAMYGAADVAKLLLKKGAPVNAYNFNGHTALMTAAFYKTLSVAKLLLQYGADIDAKSKPSGSMPGRTALLFTMCPLYGYNNEEIIQFIQLLLDYGANINAQSHTGMTLLMYAIQRQKLFSVAQFVLEKHADTTVTNTAEETVFDLAQSNDARDLLQKYSA